CPYTVDPGNGVLALRISRGERHKFFDSRELDSHVLDASRDDGPQLHLGPGNQSGQSHAADGRRVQARILGGGADELPSIRAHQLKARNVPAESSGDMMIFAVDVIGNGAAHGDELGSRKDGKEKASRHCEIENFSEGRTGLAAENSGRGVEVEQAVDTAGESRPARPQQRSVAEQANVAIAAASAHSQHASRRGRAERKLTGPVERDNFRFQFWIASPALKAGRA